MLTRPLLATLVLLCTSACVVGAPPGFSDGDVWTVPLVAPLENDLLLVPVSINDQGPFLFMVDPDSPTSAVESSLQASLKLYASRAASERATEADHMVRVVRAEVKKMSIGTLSVRNMKVRVHDDGIFWSGGRRIRGILGRDVISDSLIYHFDRDRGMMHIATQDHFKVPEGSQPLSFTQSYSAHRRYLAKFKINQKHKVTMHLDLGARTSMLWPALIKEYKLPTLPVEAELVDEYGATRRVNSGTMAGILTAKKTETSAIVMLPYGDKRLEPEDLDGIIGQNFWSKYNVTVNWHHKKFWMQPRAADMVASSKERIARWGEQLAGCATPACIDFQMSGGPAKPEPVPETTPAPAPEVAPEAAPEAAPEQPGAGAPAPAPAPPAPTMAIKPAPPTPPAKPDAPYSLLIERSAPGSNFAYDIVFGAVDAEGKLLELPIFLASFRSGVNALAMPSLDPRYGEAASFVVLDMNPIGTRGCEGSQCIYPLAAPKRTP